MTARRLRLITALIFTCAVSPLAQVRERPAFDRPDLDALYRIKEEGFQRSQLMDLASSLTDVYGPRLTASPNIRAAADFVLERLKSWGMPHATLEPWGPFGSGWSNDRFVALAVRPQSYPLIAFPKAWTPGTNGPVRAEAVMVRIDTDTDFETYRGKLGGKFVLAYPTRDVRARFEPLGRRYTDEALADLARQTPPVRPMTPPQAQPADQRGFPARMMQFFLTEGVAAVLQPSPGDGGTIFVGDGRLPDRTAPVPPQVVVAVEQYNRIARTLARQVPVTLELDIKSTFHPGEENTFNVIAELPGTDKAEEIVMFGAHFDSWHAGNGATDNAAGCAVVLEALRILKAIGLPMRRTVRLALWTGEEQGLLGSRAYVTDHFADRRTMQLKAEHSRLSVYFNHDNGTGLIRGLYLQGNEAVAPIFETWMEPFENFGMKTLSIRNTGGTDHLAFDAVGLPGFQFIQDPIEYETRTHHSNMDVYDRLQAGDLMQNAVIIASFVYETANREQLLPRKPLPAPQPAPSPASRN